MESFIRKEKQMRKGTIPMFPYAIPIMNFDVFQWVKLVKRTIFWINLKSVKWNNRFIYHFTSFFFFADSPFFLQIVEIYCCELYPGLHQEKKERKEMCEWETLLRKFFGINGKKGKKSFISHSKCFFIAWLSFWD